MPVSQTSRGGWNRNPQENGWNRNPQERKVAEGDVVFTQEELLVLDSGIKYAPSKPFNQFEAFIDLQKFIRKLNLKKHFFRKRREYYTTG